MKNYKIIFPEGDKQLDQDEEFFFLNTREGEEKIMFHEYDKIYAVPGLYENLFQKKLECQSPEVIAGMLTKTLQEGEDNSLRVLDFGAGNGLVAEKLNEQDPDIIIGVDILKSAKNAASRDRKGLYEDYLVSDLARPEGGVMKKLESYEFNAMVSVAALGFGHIPPLAFVNAFNLVETSGLIAFNIRDKFLTREDETGFRATLDRMTGESLETIDEKIYRHRYALNGEPINYVAIVARKITDMENPAGPKLNTDLDTESFEVKNS